MSTATKNVLNMTNSVDSDETVSSGSMLFVNALFEDFDINA